MLRRVCSFVTTPHTVEIIPELAQPAEPQLAGRGYSRVHARQAEDYFGWEEPAPFPEITAPPASGPGRK